MKPIIININELNKVNPLNDCFIIKNVFDISKCKKIVLFLKNIKQNYKINEKINSENWYYNVKSNGNFFTSFIFNELSKVDNNELNEAFKIIFDLYIKLGEKTFYNNFSKEITINNFITDYKIINPLVFCYYIDKSKFGFHKHNKTMQNFQLLMNLTQPNEDYINGETWVYPYEHPPNINCKNLKKNCYIFGNEFGRGDVFSFPYRYWHCVQTPKFPKVISGINARISLLMPLGHRNSVDYRNEYL